MQIATLCYSLWYHVGIRGIFLFSNSWVVKRVPFSTFITRSACEVFYLLATVASCTIYPALHLENCIRFQDITVSEPLWASERGVVKPRCDDCTGKQWYTRPARPQTEGRRTHKHGPRLKCLCPPDQGTWNRLYLQLCQEGGVWDELHTKTTVGVLSEGKSL